MVLSMLSYFKPNSYNALSCEFIVLNEVLKSYSAIMLSKIAIFFSGNEFKSFISFKMSNFPRIASMNLLIKAFYIKFKGF